MPRPDQVSDHSPGGKLLTCKSGLKRGYQGFGEGEPGQKMGKALRSKRTAEDQRRRAQHTGRAALPLQASTLLQTRLPKGSHQRACHFQDLAWLFQEQGGQDRRGGGENSTFSL